MELNKLTIVKSVAKELCTLLTFKELSKEINLITYMVNNVKYEPKYYPKGFLRWYLYELNKEMHRRMK